MFKEIIKPTLTIIVIAVVVSTLLAFTYNAAGIADLGGALTPAELEEYAPVVLPGSTKLVSAKTEVSSEGIDAVYRDEGGSGSAFMVTTKGYGGDLVILIGIDSEGKIAGAQTIENSETPGLGERAVKAEYLDKFRGKGESGIVTVKKPGEGGDVDAIAGSTISSLAVGDAMNLALAAYQEVKGELE